MIDYRIGDVYDRLAEIPNSSVDLVVTSPPFLGLRSYLPADHPDKNKEIGQEANPAGFIDSLLAVTRELRRVLAPYGSLCVELGDTYSGSGGAGGDYQDDGWRGGQPNWRQQRSGGWPKEKSKALIPEAYRIALAYGINPLTGTKSPAGEWRIRNVVTWCRPNPPVGRLGDKWRPGTSDIVVAATSYDRYWDDIATRKPHVVDPEARADSSGRSPKRSDGLGDSGTWDTKGHEAGAPLLDWWEIVPGAYEGAHYAVYPPELVVPLVKAMCPQRVCRTCGEPSRRIVEKTPEYAEHMAEAEGRTLAPVGERLNRIHEPGPHWRRRDGEYLDGGWTDCGHDDWRPGLVLDPFAGSGTTLYVADALGRDAIGIDIDERNQRLFQARRDDKAFNLLRQGTLL